MNIGDYVRTIKGFGKVEKIEILKKDTIIYLDSGITIDYITKDFTKDEINKMYPSSPNIIDLIEDGDYVNGYKIVVINDIKHIETKNGLEFFGIFWITNIKSIVTREQFSCMEYKI